MYLSIYIQQDNELIDQLNKKINDVKSDMRIRNKVGPVVLTDTDFNAIYKKVLSSCSDYNTRYDGCVFVYHNRININGDTVQSVFTERISQKQRL